MGLYQYWLVIIVVVVELCFYTSNSQHLTCHPRDQEALRELYPYQYVWNTNSSKNCCEWVGITCNSSYSLGLNDRNNTARVTKLEFTNNAFGWDRLSESLGRLHQIRVLNLSNNRIRGSIPTSIFNLVNLEILDLSSNHLSELSESLGRLHQIRVLNLSNNRIGGSIPTSIFNLVNLEILDLSSNWLSGSLSPALGNLSSLVHLDLSGNAFLDEIPDVFSKLLKLKTFVVYHNEFTGGIPNSLVNSQSLVLLSMGYNFLSGTLRLNCDVMTNLTTLDLGSNKFNGSLPDNLPSCRNLRNVNLAENLFDGQVPQSFRDFHSLLSLSLTMVKVSAALDLLRHCKNLTALVLADNFHGEMLPDHPSLHFKKLKVLIVQNCSLTGPLPSWLSKSTNLQVLDLSLNNFTGAIPNWIGGFSNLLYLDLSGNSLTGEIPKSLTTLESLSSRDVSFNETSLVFPFLYRRNEFGALKFLPTLDLSQNNLSGPIWEEFGNLKKLHVFNLSANKLSGWIPQELSGMMALEVLDLSNNSISGSIPISLENLTSLNNFNVANNNLSGRVPSGRFLIFSSQNFVGNQLCGYNWIKCPVDTSDTEFVSDSSYNGDFFLDFTNGLATGYCLALVIVAALTWSFFPFPELSGMMALEVLDLSNNSISGSIPISLEKLPSIYEFNVANNNLWGKIPIGGGFPTHPNWSFEGNHLCREDLHPCQIDSNDTNFVSDFPNNKPSGASDSDYILDFTKGLAVGYCLALIIVAALTWSSFQLPRK